MDNTGRDTTAESVIWVPGEEQGKDIFGESVDAPSVTGDELTAARVDLTEDELEETTTSGSTTEETGTTVSG